MADDIPHAQTIELGFRELDEAGARILRWQPASEDKVPLPRNDPAGIIELAGGEVPIRVDTVFLDYRFGSISFGMDRVGIVRHDSSGQQVSRGRGPWFGDGGARATVLNRWRAQSKQMLADCMYVSVDFARCRTDLARSETREEGLANPSASPRAARDRRRSRRSSLAGHGRGFGGSWVAPGLLRGTAVHPSVWEGETEGGPVWCIRADDVDPFPCLPFRPACDTMVSTA